jgi:hypothetical protein
MLSTSLKGVVCQNLLKRKGGKGRVAAMEILVVTAAVARTYLKNMDQGSGQGAGRQKSGAYTVVCEHFEPTRNPRRRTMGP